MDTEIGLTKACLDDGRVVEYHPQACPEAPRSALGTVAGFRHGGSEGHDPYHIRPHPY